MNDDATNWEPLDAADSLPGHVEDWLAEPGSLTQRVRMRCHDDFRLRVLAEYTRHDLAIFSDLQPGDVFCREITLGCDTTPLVFARTRIPAATMTACSWLGNLGETPLGARLFDEPGYMRGRFLVARLVPGDELYDHVNAEVVGLNDELWARRARVELDGNPLEICECFLPGLT